MEEIIFLMTKTSPFQVEFVFKPDKTKVDFGIDGTSAAKFLQSAADNVFNNTLHPVLLV